MLQALSPSLPGENWLFLANPQDFGPLDYRPLKESDDKWGTSRLPVDNFFSAQKRVGLHEIWNLLLFHIGAKNVVATYYVSINIIILTHKYLQSSSPGDAF